MTTMVGYGIDQLMIIQDEVSGMVPGTITPEVTNDQVTRACFALSGEVFELAQELGWKDWKDNPAWTKEYTEVVAEEFADVLAFLGLVTSLVCRRTGLTPYDLAEAYRVKTAKNIKRFEGTSGEKGYSGVRWVDRPPGAPEQLKFEF